VSVRKRTWKSPNGEMKEAWVVDYVDQHGDRHIKTFAKKRDADAHHAIVSVTVRAGTHTADSKSVTVAKAAELWLASCDAAGLERTTITAYRQHGNLLFSKYRAKVSQKVRMWERDKDVTSSRIIQ